MTVERIKTEIELALFEETDPQKKASLALDVFSQVAFRHRYPYFDIAKIAIFAKDADGDYFILASDRAAHVERLSRDGMELAGMVNAEERADLLAQVGDLILWPHDVTAGDYLLSPETRVALLPRLLNMLDSQTV